MQRRLFVFFLLLSLIPAAAILVVNWQVSQRHLGFLDSPGLRETLESSLDLARTELGRQMELVSHEMDELTSQWAEPGQGSVLLHVVAGKIQQSAGDPDESLRRSLLELAAGDRRERSGLHLRRGAGADHQGRRGLGER